MLSKIMALRAVTLAGAVSLAACTTVNPYTGEQQTSKVAKGAGIGALAGAVLGAATSNDRKRGALRGAAAGALLGGGVGYYMDVQEAQLRQRLAQSGIQVQREGDNIRLIMPGNITFASNSGNLNASFYPTLNDVALVLAEFDKTTISVAGHTDSTGSDSYNQQLSEQRASSVGGYLIAQGVSSARVQTQGFGERYPVADNSNAAGRQANRRVELQLIPMASLAK